MVSDSESTSDCASARKVWKRGAVGAGEAPVRAENGINKLQVSELPMYSVFEPPVADSPDTMPGALLLKDG